MLTPIRRKEFRYRSDHKLVLSTSGIESVFNRILSLVYSDKINRQRIHSEKFQHRKFFKQIKKIHELKQPYCNIYYKGIREIHFIHHYTGESKDHKH